MDRRGFLTSGLCAFGAQSAFAQSLATPPANGAVAGDLGAVIGARALAGRVSCIVLDAASGAVLEAHAPDLDLPPASAIKAATALYALDQLGEDHRFITRALADGPIQSGRLAGDLWLLGGGDPHLDTDGLSALVDQLASAGLRSVTGRVIVARGAWPFIEQIDPTQPETAGYNPTISGLNLNFNRVYLDWRPRADGAGFEAALDARSETLRPPVAGIGLELSDRTAPVLEYRPARGDRREGWSLALPALTEAGGRWLPVRAPEIYAGEVFMTLARAAGITVEAGLSLGQTPPASAQILAEVSSARIVPMLRAMLRYSTNLTAEIMGISASMAQGGRVAELRQSGDAMADWIAARVGGRRANLRDHSGLSGDSAMRVGELAALLAQGNARARLSDLLRAYDLEEAALPNVRVLAKTGTLNFVSTLAGYIEGPNRVLSFAIFAADMPRRAALSPRERERPAGNRAYLRAAREMKADILTRWANLYG